MTLDELVRQLDGHRRHVIGSLEGLGDEDLRRSVLPSGWTCLGMVRHLAMDVERFWFSAVLNGDREAIDELDSLGDDAWKVPPDVPAHDVLDLYRRETAAANAVIQAATADTSPAWWRTDWPDENKPADLTQILLHVIGETACHAGHLDIVRELIDGKRWLVLTS